MLTALAIPLYFHYTQLKLPNSTNKISGDIATKAPNDTC